jgi:hypothetical protein
VGAVEGSYDSEELTMQTVSTIGLDIARSVFQIHGADANGVVVSLKWDNVGDLEARRAGSFYRRSSARSALALLSSRVSKPSVNRS